MISRSHRRHHFEKEELDNSPSRLDGFSAEQEARWRRRYIRLVEQTAAKYAIDFPAHQTAIVYLHHYYAMRSMATNDPLIMVAAALYLACKVEEQPKSLSKVSEAVYSTYYKPYPRALSLLMKQETFLLLKQRVLIAERSLLYVLGFNMDVQHASQIGIKYMQNHYNALLPKHLRVSPAEWHEQIKQQGPSFTTMNQLCEITWKLFLLSFHIPYYLHFEPRHIAAGCIYACLQMMQLQTEPEQGWHWYEMLPFECPISVLGEIAMLLIEVVDQRDGIVPEEGPPLPEGEQ